MKTLFSAFENISPEGFCECRNQLNDFITNRHLNLLCEAEERRNSINTEEELRIYAEEMRKRFLYETGGIPKRNCELNAKTVKVIDMGNFTLENIVFNSRKNVYVTGTLYIPKGITEPSPAVLFLCGHFDKGRMADNYQDVCQILVNAGLVVFAIDSTGQGERKNFYDKTNGEFPINLPVYDHDSCGIPSLAVGKHLQAYFLSDQLAAVDYMITRKEIDANRIGVTGNSGGGLQTLCAMVCDNRIAAAAPATFTSTKEEILYTWQAQDSEQIWPASSAYGFDHYEPFIIFAPKPVAILAVTSDFFPIEGTRKVYNKTKEIYELLGKEKNVYLFEDDYHHYYTDKLASFAAKFFCETFNVKSNTTDYAIKRLSVEEIKATEKAGVLSCCEDALSICDETDIIANALKEKRTENAYKWLEEKVMKNRLLTDFNVRFFDKGLQVCNNGYTGIGAMWSLQKRLFAFGTIISKGISERVGNKETVIAVWEDGTTAINKHSDVIQKWCEQEKQVLVLDLPGMGHIQQNTLCGSYKGHYGTLYRFCCGLLFMDDSMAAMQTYHILRTIDMVKEILKVKDITLYCDNCEGVYGIMAGYLNKCVKMEYGNDLLKSIQKEILSQRPLQYNNTLSYIIPNMLNYFDYDELM